MEAAGSGNPRSDIDDLLSELEEFSPEIDRKLLDLEELPPGIHDGIRYLLGATDSEIVQIAGKIGGRAAALDFLAALERVRCMGHEGHRFLLGDELGDLVCYEPNLRQERKEIAAIIFAVTSLCGLAFGSIYLVGSTEDIPEDVIYGLMAILPGIVLLILMVLCSMVNFHFNQDMDINHKYRGKELTVKAALTEIANKPKDSDLEAAWLILREIFGVLNDPGVNYIIKKGEPYLLLRDAPRAALYRSRHAVMEILAHCRNGSSQLTPPEILSDLRRYDSDLDSDTSPDTNYTFPTFANTEQLDAGGETVEQVVSEFATVKVT